MSKTLFDNTSGDREMIVRRRHIYGDEQDVHLFVAPGQTLEAGGGCYAYEVTQDGKTPAPVAALDPPPPPEEIPPPPPAPEPVPEEIPTLAPPEAPPAE